MIFRKRLINNILDSEELVNAKTYHRKTAEPLLTFLPNVFTIKQLQDVRVKNGQSSNVKNILHVYCKQNKIKRIGRGVYQRLEVR